MTTEYYRRDRAEGITAPDLSKSCTYAEHVVHARGKRTQFTSISLDPERIRDFGETLYRLRRDFFTTQRHVLVEHEALVASLNSTAKEGEGRERDLALRAVRRVRNRKEGLIEWRFNISGVERKDLITWASGKVSEFFVRA